MAIKENKETLLSYGKDLKLNFPFYMDPQGQIANDYGVRSHPTGFFIDPQGRIVGRFFGGRDWVSSSAKNFIKYLLGPNTSNRNVGQSGRSTIIAAQMRPKL